MQKKKAATKKKAASKKKTVRKAAPKIDAAKQEREKQKAELRAEKMAQRIDEFFGLLRKDDESNDDHVESRGPGRPPEYDDETASIICILYAEGISLRKISSLPGMPAKSTILRWVLEIPEFSDQYARASDLRADGLADDVIDIADEVTAIESVDVQKAKLRVDTRKWAAAKLKPKKYSEKIDINNNHSGSLAVGALSDDELDRRIAELLRGPGSGEKSVTSPAP